MAKELIVLSLVWIASVVGETVVRFSLQEELPVRTLVGSIADESGLRQNMSSEEFSSLQYNFLDQTKMQTLFDINNGDGSLYTKVVIDREIECGFREICHLKFDVMAHSSVTSKFVILPVEVLLLDTNDKIPVFQPSSVSLQVLESAAIGTTLGIEDATDDDSTSKNRIKSYQILPVDGAFGLNATQKSDGGFILKLVLNKRLDRETKSRYQLQVVAQDGGSESNSGVLNVAIDVLDDNDNSPAFEHKFYNVTINEDVDVGTFLVKLSASDKDSGENGQVIYRFNSRQTELDTFKQYFDLNETSGVLRVKNKLRYDVGDNYEILVEASDLGKQPLVDQAVVQITVLDVKNNPPVVRINFLSSGNSRVVNVSESKVGGVIAHVTVEDSDSGQNGNVSCLVSDLHFDLRVVQGKGYVLILSSALDRELESSLNVSVVCSDQGSPVLTTMVNFVVKVTDENDQTPEFTQSLYLASIMENNAVGDIVTQISAHDKDIGQNAVVRYYLHTDSDNKFVINSDTGVITANELFDRETSPFYNFTVLAIDSGNTPLTGTASVRVKITDDNDNAPIFDEPMFQFFITENMAPNTVVGILSASDLDEGQNSKFYFKLSGNATSALPFYLLQDGTLKTMRTLDREQQGKYELSVLAYDLGVPSRNNTTRVIVYVTDENDETPVIRYPSKVNNTVSISYLAPVGSLIAHVKAHDRDEQGRNSQLTYEFIRGNDLKLFTIGRTTGKIFLAKTYQIQADVTFPVTVSVSDMGKVPHTSSQDFHIVLRFTNESVQGLSQDVGNRNIIISGVLVALTFVISVVIVTVICIIKRNDDKSAGNASSKSTPLYCKAIPYTVTMETKESNNLTKANNTPLETPKKKKEVSFSLEDREMQLAESYSNSVFSDSANPGTIQHCHDNALPPGYRQNEPIKSLHLNQLTSPNLQKPFITQDNISDSSGDVTNSDSGRGGSDLDLTQSNRTENLKMTNHSPRHSSRDFPYPPPVSHQNHPMKSSHPNNIHLFRMHDTTTDSLHTNGQNRVHYDDKYRERPELPPGENKWHPSYV